MKKRISKVITPAVLAASFTVNSFGISSLADESFTFIDEDMEDEDDPGFSTGKEFFLDVKDESGAAIPNLKAGDVTIKLEPTEDVATDSDLSTYTGSNDDTGRIKIDNIENGTYKLTVTKAPDGFETGYYDEVTLGDLDLQSGNTNGRWADLKLKQVEEKTSFDLTINVNYMDQEDPTPVDDVEIVLYKDGSEHDTQRTVGGTVNFTELEKGKYEYEVRSVPEGYSFSEIGTRYSLTLEKEDVTVDIEITKEVPVESHELQITVQDSKTGDPISGATLALYKEDGEELVTEEETNEVGIATFSNLTELSYVLKESAMPEGYSLDETWSKNITFKATEAMQKGTYNKVADADKENSFIVYFRHKRDEEETYDDVDGVTLSIYNYEGGQKTTPYGDGTYTSSGGMINLGSIPAGKYYLSFEVPEEYSGVQPQILEITPENEGKALSLNIDMQLCEEITSGVLILHLFGIADDADQNKPIEGASIKVKSTDDKGYDKTITTDDAGEARIDDIPFGKYSYKIASASNYQLTDEEHPFEISAKNPKVEEGRILYEMKQSFAISLKAYKTGDDQKTPLEGSLSGELYRSDKISKIKDFTIENGGKIEGLAPGTYNVKLTSVPEGYYCPSDMIEVTITDGDVEKGIALPELTSSYSLDVTVADKTGKGVEGVEVEFTYADGTSIGEGTYTSEAEGKIHLEGLDQDIVKYTMKKVPQDGGYIVDENTHTVTTTGGSVRNLSIKVEKPEEVSAEYKVQFYAEEDVTKEHPLSGFDIDVYEGTDVSEIALLSVPRKLTTRKEADGSIIVEDMTYGDYTVIITEAPDNYKEMIGGRSSIKVTASSDEPIPYALLLSDIEEANSATLIVRDSVTHTGIAGVSIDLERPDHSHMDLLTGEDGSILVPNLPDGDYHYTIEDAPMSYELAESGQFTISSAEGKKNKEVQIELTAVTGTVKVTVTGLDDGSLEGLTVTLGDLPISGSRADGVFTFDNVPAGTYEVHVNGVPDGFAPESAQSVTVDRNNKNPSVSYAFVEKEEDKTVTFNITAEGRGEQKLKITLHVYRKDDDQEVFVNTYTVENWTGDTAKYDIQLPEGEYCYWYQTSGSRMFYSDTTRKDFSVTKDGGTQISFKVGKTTYRMGFDPFVLGEPANIDPSASKLNGKDIYIKYTVDSEDEKEFVISNGVVYMFGDPSHEGESLIPGKKYSFKIDTKRLPEHFTLAENMAGKETVDFQMSAASPAAVQYYIYLDYHAHKNVTFPFIDGKTAPLSGVNYTIDKTDGPDSSGKSQWTGTTSGEEIVQDLEYGNYTLTVTPPEGYEAVGDTVTHFVVSGSEGSRVSSQFKKILYGGVTLSVKHKGSEAVPGAKLHVVGPDYDNPNVTTTGDGTVKLDKLKVGHYTVTVTEADGYIIDGQMFSFDITRDGEEVSLDIPVMNDDDEHERYSVSFTIQDTDTMEAVPGSVKVFYADSIDEHSPGDPVGEWEFKDGTATVSGLKAGNYTYEVELDDKYETPKRTTGEGNTFTIKPDGNDTIELTTKEKEKTIRISADSSISGVSVNIDGKDYPLENGSVEVTLKYGDHEMTITVPDGYLLSGETTRTLTINDDTTDIRLALSPQPCVAEISVIDEFTKMMLKSTTGGTITLQNTDTGRTYLSASKITPGTFVLRNLTAGHYEYDVKFTDGIHKDVHGSFDANHKTVSSITISVEHMKGDLTVKFVDQNGTEIKDENYYVTFSFAEETDSSSPAGPDDVVIHSGETKSEMSRGKYDYTVTMPIEAGTHDGGTYTFNKDTDTLTVNVTVGLADLEEINDAIGEADALGTENTKYTESTWNELQKALKAAKDLVNRPDGKQPTAADQAAIDAAAADLAEKYDALKELADTSSLSQKLQEIEDESLESGDYTPRSWQRLQNAIRAAEALIANKDLSIDDQQQVTDALTELTEAYENLAPEDTADFEALRQAISDVNDRKSALNQNEYTTDSWNNLQNTISEAQQMLTDQTADSDEVDAMIQALSDAFEDLVKLANYKDLDDLITEAEKITDDGNYTADSFAAFEQALTAAQGIDRNLDTSRQSEIDAKKNELQQAMDQLDKLDFTSLAQAMMEAIGSGRMAEDYTSSSWAPYAKYMQDAIEMAQDHKLAKGSQQAIDDLTQNLKDAVSGLEEVADFDDLKDAIAAAADYEDLDDDYTPDSFDAFMDAYADAKALAANTDVAKSEKQAEIDEAAQKLWDAIDDLKEKPADFTYLDELIEEADQLNRDYYEDTTAFEKALADAKALRQETGLTKKDQDRVDDIADALESAMFSLVMKDADCADLEAAIGEADLLKQEHYTEETWMDLQNAVSAAKNLLKENPKIDQQNEVTEAAKAIREAITALEDAVERDDAVRIGRDGTITVISDHFAKDEVKTFSVWVSVEPIFEDAEVSYTAIFSDAMVHRGTYYPDEKMVKINISAIDPVMTGDETELVIGKITVKTKYGKDVAAILEVKEDQLKYVAGGSQKTAEINPVMQVLDGVTPAQTADLQDAYDRALGLLNGNYTDSSLAALEIAVSEAGDLLDRADLTSDDQHNINSLLELLEATINALKEKADYSDLDRVLAEAEGLNEDDYTTDSWKALQDAIRKAGRVDRDLSVDDQNQIDQAAEAVQSAMDNLDKKVPEVKTGTFTSVVRVVDDGSKLDNVEIEILKEGSVVTTERTVNGEFTVKLPYGSYTARISSIPLGFEPNDKEISFEISEAHKEHNWVWDVHTVEIPATSKALTLTVLGDEGKPVPGVVLRVKGEGFEKTYTTGNDGVVITDELQFGMYEISQASVPAGYVIDKTVYQVEVSETSDSSYRFFTFKEIPVIKDADLSALKAAVTEAEAKKQSGYTTSSWNAFAEALKNAKAVLAESGLTENDQARVDTAKDALTKAMNALVRRSSGGSGSSGGGGGSSSSSSSGIVGNGPAMGTAVSGTWSYDAPRDKWTFNFNQYKNQWVYVYNPYATVTQGQYDWFYFDENGEMVTGWFTDKDGLVYYLNETSDGTRGAMETGWKWIGGKCYYFHEKSDGTRGHLLKGTTTPDGYIVDETGAWTVDGIAVVR